MRIYRLKTGSLFFFEGIRSVAARADRISLAELGRWLELKLEQDSTLNYLRFASEPL